MDNRSAVQSARNAPGRISAVAIGRNEGDRLRSCLLSLMQRTFPVLYVDSGSTDGSVEMARDLGVEVITLDMSVPFTAARARNAGYARVQALDPNGAYVQFIDGDCDLDSDWLATARAALEAEPYLAVVCGRRREKHPNASLWNHLVDLEWDSPIGDVKACGGDALIRRIALDAVGGYREDFIAGEEPEMCFRMRAKGWRIRRIAAEMTRHDAAMTHISQWWQRCRRAGHTYAEGVAVHGQSPERYRLNELRRALIWGLGLPLGGLIGTLILSPVMLLLLLAYPLQILRLHRRCSDWGQATFLVLSKFAETQGVLGYWWERIFGRRQTLIEYK
ncbi:glycosyltransferase [Pseudophaeobacter sp.]|uniref:glycosyltransferase family 2 protein n=1 Tax=Rhodobacterales TaxID=204455 RepID=UPI00329A59FC